MAHSWDSSNLHTSKSIPRHYWNHRIAPPSCVRPSHPTPCPHTDPMAPLKALDRSATVAYCPGSGLMAAGTVAGAIDMSFSTSSTLDVSAMITFDAPRCAGTCVAHASD